MTASTGWILAGAVLGVSVLGSAVASSVAGGGPPAPPLVAAARSFEPEPACAGELAEGDAAAATSRLLVPSGRVRPFYRDAGTSLEVRAFLVDRAPVTRGAFLSFLRCRPELRRSRVAAVLAERRYLADWRGDLDPGDDPNTAVGFVSWFAARAFCESRGMRLPTTLEWERAFGAPGLASEGVGFAMGRAVPELAGLGAVFAGIWEWTLDFGAAPVASGAALSQFCGDGIRSNRPEDYGAFLRYSFRSSLKANYTLENLGFRCASDGAP